MARGLKKGQTNNPNGRKPGVPNKTTKEMKIMVNAIVSGQLPKIQATLEKLRTKEPEKYLDLLFRLMRFVLAQKTDVTSDDEPIRNPININYIIPKSGGN